VLQQLIRAKEGNKSNKCDYDEGDGNKVVAINQESLEIMRPR